MKRPIVIVLVIVALGVAWYLFRPERLFINQTVNESFPATPANATAAAQPKELASGQFHDVAHKGVGTAAVYELPDGKKVLRFTNFETSNGPDVQVYLVAADDATDNDTVTRAGFFHVGALTGNVGDQNYDLPSDIDLNKYRAITIWCRRFGVNFATAPLSMTGAPSAAVATQPVVILSGDFHDVAHKSVGKAAIYQLPDGKRLLRFSDFETSNGPDVQIYLVGATDATDSETVKQAGFISLGPIKGNVGDQNYEVPENVDLNRYRAVTIWCRRFGVNFGTAPLTAPQS